MNDSSEYLYAKEQFIGAYQNRTVYVEEVPRYLANITLHSHEPATLMMLGCLTEDGDDLALWDRYADRAQGCAIGIDAHWLQERAGVAIRRVLYGPERVREHVNAGLAMLQTEYESHPSSHDQLLELARYFIFDLYAFKHPNFQSEREIRVSRMLVTDDAAEFGLLDAGGTRVDGTRVAPLNIQQREGLYGPTRYVDLPLTDGNIRSAIVEIGLGPKFPASEEPNIRELADAIGAEVRRSMIPFR